MWRDGLGSLLAAQRIGLPLRQTALTVSAGAQPPDARIQNSGTLSCLLACQLPTFLEGGLARVARGTPTLGETQSKMDVVRFEREQLWITRFQQVGSHAQIGIDGTSGRSGRNIESCGTE